MRLHFNMLVRLRAASLSLLLVGFALALILLVWYSTQRQIDDARRQLLGGAARDAASFARVIEEHSVRTIQSADQAVRFLAYEYKQKGARLDLRRALDTGIILGDIFNLYSIVGADGALVLSSQPSGPVNLSDREHIRVHRESSHRGLFVSKPVLGRVSGKWSIQLTRRIDLSDGSFGGVVVVSMDPFYFTRLYESVQIGAHSVVALVGDDGIVRARRSGTSPQVGDDKSADAATQIGRDVSAGKLFRLIQAQGNGVLDQESMIDGRQRIYAFRHLENYPLAVVVGIDTADVLSAYSPLRARLTAQASVVTGGIVLFTALLLALIRRLVRSRAQAVSANATKTQFLSNMSHELRTPLNGILGYAELLRDELTDDEQRSFAAIIHGSGTHLLQLVNQILQLNRIESGNDQVVLVEEDLHSLVSQAVNTHRSSAMAKRLLLEARIGSEVPARIECDRMKLLQVLNNLLHNAIKFTDSGTVHLAISRHADRLRFAVIDTGRGIPPEMLDKVFEKFFQVDSGDARLNDGTGLGLALVRELVTLMGGRVGIVSEPGRGSTVHFDMPCREVPAHREAGNGYLEHYA